MNRASASIVATDGIDPQSVNLVKFGTRRPSAPTTNGGGGQMMIRRRSSLLRDLTVPKHAIIPDGDDLVEWEDALVEYAPDAGWAWVVAVASLLNNFVLDGVSFSYGVLTQKMTEHGTLSEFQYHLCGSVMLGTTLIIGPLVSLMGSRYGFRVVSILGSVISALGFFLSWACSPEVPSFLALLLGFGVLGGIGFGLMFTSSIVVLGKFFAANLPLATGIATTGSAVGSIIMPKVLGWIVEAWGWQGSYIFLAGCCLFSAVFGAFYTQPPKRMEKVRKFTKVQSDLSDLWELMASPTFWILSLAGGIVVLGYFVPSAFLADRALAPPFNSTTDEATWLPSIIGGSNTVGRILFGILANSDRAVYSLLFTNVAVTLGGIATIGSVYATEYWMLAVYAFVYGQIIAVYASLRSVIVYQLVGKDKFNLAFGVSLFFMGVSLYFGNAFAGWLKDSTGDFDMTFHYTGAFFILSAILCYPLPWIYKYETSKKPRRYSTSASHP
ncbi:monocarboxylate transporter 13 isoform X1 [Folsomia candida]|uniref:monocarboxylate transporter 13 isoform X1 n=1 Tax=Folsomia candida TaxID=158441 RepID=UPI000B8F4EF2|nr:monocarboxylate transporter 13 isoform X1 [Folsomia candida]